MSEDTAKERCIIGHSDSICFDVVSNSILSDVAGGQLTDKIVNSIFKLLSVLFNEVFNNGIDQVFSEVHEIIEVVLQRSSTLDTVSLHIVAVTSQWGINSQDVFLNDYGN